MPRAGATRRQGRPRSGLPIVLGLSALALVLAVALVVLLTGGSEEPQPDRIAAGDKVSVVGGELAGASATVLAARPGGTQVRLEDGTTATLTEADLRERPLAAGDWVRAGKDYARVLQSPGDGDELVVRMEGGERRTLARERAAYVSSAHTPFAQPSCVAGATDVTSAKALEDAVAEERDVCATADVGDVDLSGLQPAKTVNVGTNGGSLGHVDLVDASNLTLNARFRSTVMAGSSDITIEHSIIGGTPEERVPDQLIFISDDSPDVTIRENDIGWTTADDSGNTGYGLRVYADSDRLRIERNYIHHVGADGLQLGSDGSDVLIDRNEIAYASPPKGSSEHSDDIQVTGNGPNLRITNNYLHHNGWLTEDGPRSGGSGPYIHGGDDDSFLFENNLVRDEANFMQIGNLGVGGTRRSNLTLRGNTFAGNGTAFGDKGADLAWRLSGGRGNVYERNLVSETLWNEFGFRGVRVSDNLDEKQPLDADGGCRAEACTTAGGEPIGYRRPAGVHW